MLRSTLSVREQPSDREVLFSRAPEAPRELVWKMWSELRHLDRWWGPAGFTTTTHEFAFVEGGAWRFVMHGPDGTDYPNRIVFREIDPPSRIAYDNCWDLPGAPVDFTAVLALDTDGARTKLSLRMTFTDAESFRKAVELYGVLDGGTQTLDRLAEYVNSVVSG
ncbi:MAG: SRPBCC domain-containing protein [Gemmatimonadota bacterium]